MAHDSAMRKSRAEQDCSRPLYLPYGSDAWREKVAEQLNLTHTLRPRGRPRKQSTNETESKK
jgi:hypothetical protein